MRAEETKDGAIVSIAVIVEADEVACWLAQSEGFSQGVDWATASQDRLKHAVTARAEYELLNERRPSPLTRPLIVAAQDIQEGVPFEFTISFAVLPASDLTDYEPIALPLRRPEVTDDEVQKLFEATIGGVTATTPKGDGAVVEDGDTVDIALESVSDGKVYHPLTASKRYYELGSGFMPKDFDDMLRGMAVGQRASVDLKVPQADTPYDEPSRYIDVRVTATVKGIMRDSASSVDDAWVQSQFPGIAGVDDLKRALRRQLQAEKDDMYAQSSAELLLRKLAERLQDGSIPDAVLELQSQEALENIRTQLDAQGRTMDEFLERQNMDEKALRLSLMMDVRTQDRQMMALDAWARRYGLRPTEEDRERYRALVARDVGAEAAEQILGAMYEGALEESVLRMMAQRAAAAS